MDNRFIPYLYERNSVPSMIKHYCEDLINFGLLNPIERMKIDRFLLYRQYLRSVEFKERLVKLFEEIDRQVRTNTCQIALTGRQKGLFSTLNKLEELETSTMESLQIKFITQVCFKSEFEAIESKVSRASFLSQKLDFMTQSTEMQEAFQAALSKKSFIGNKNPFESVRDFFGFRIILEDDYAEQRIEELYEIANMIIRYFSEKGFQIVKPEKLPKPGLLKVSDPDLYLPTKSGIKPEYRSFVKDYVIAPKPLGYQSLHIIFIEPISTKMFEIQLRTQSMELVANTIANHDDYKAGKYGIQQAQETSIEYDKIHVTGFRYKEYTKNKKTLTELYDNAGITKCLTLISKTERKYDN